MRGSQAKANERAELIPNATRPSIEDIGDAPTYSTRADGIAGQINALSAGAAAYIDGMSANISTTAEAARESARATDGRFGPQAHSAPSVSLPAVDYDGPGQLKAPSAPSANGAETARHSRERAMVQAGEGLFVYVDDFGMPQVVGEPVDGEYEPFYLTDAFDDLELHDVRDRIDGEPGHVISVTARSSLDNPDLVHVDVLENRSLVETPSDDDITLDEDTLSEYEHIVSRVYHEQFGAEVYADRGWDRAEVMLRVCLPHDRFTPSLTAHAVEQEYSRLVDESERGLVREEIKRRIRTERERGA